MQLLCGATCTVGCCLEVGRRRSARCNDALCAHKAIAITISTAGSGGVTTCAMACEVCYELWKGDARAPSQRLGLAVHDVRLAAKAVEDVRKLQADVAGAHGDDRVVVLRQVVERQRLV